MVDPYRRRWGRARWPLRRHRPSSVNNDVLADNLALLVIVWSTESHEAADDHAISFTRLSATASRSNIIGDSASRYFTTLFYSAILICALLITLYLDVFIYNVEHKYVFNRYIYSINHVIAPRRKLVYILDRIRVGIIYQTLISFFSFFNDHSQNYMTQISNVKNKIVTPQSYNILHPYNLYNFSSSLCIFC